MEQALSLAKLALGQVSPNPAVGAVIVKEGTIVGQGYTQPPGGEHAEVAALKQAGNKARGGTLYVTLEPCNCYGRTPPCSKAIIEAGIAEVHMASYDDNPDVCGQGKKEIEAAGVKVYVGEHEEESRRLNEAYIKYKKTGLPFVTAKYAMSLDGKIATRTGDSKWISNQESRQFAHHIRYTSDAIMVGVNTVLIDDPHLTTRCAHGRGGAVRKQPLRVVVDDSGRVPLGARLFSEPGETVVAVAGKLKALEKTALGKAGAELVEMASEDGLVDIKGLLKYLAGRGVTSVLVEGGGMLLGSMFDKKLVDKVVAFIAPIIIGGAGAKTPVAGLGVDKVAGAIGLKQMSMTTFGQDIMVTGYIDGGS